MNAISIPMLPILWAILSFCILTIYIISREKLKEENLFQILLFGYLILNCENTSPIGAWINKSGFTRPSVGVLLINTSFPP